MPSVFETRSRVKFTREEGLFLLCTRFAWPTRLKTMEFLFGYGASSISEAVNWVLYFIDNHWNFLLNDFTSGHLSTTRLLEFAKKVRAKGAPLDCCWGFIDCTIRQICRPKKWQQDCYNGYKHLHALKYSAVKCPDGLIYHVFGPYEGRRNDNALLRESELLARRREFAPSFYLYGDPAYPLSSVLISPFSHLTGELSESQKIFNKRMSSCREAVEWGFADVVRLWTSLDFKSTQRVFTSPVGCQYRVAVILTNIHICLYGSETSLYFNCSPPTLSQYLVSPHCI